MESFTGVDTTNPIYSVSRDYSTASVTSFTDTTPSLVTNGWVIATFGFNNNPGTITLQNDPNGISITENPSYNATLFVSNLQVQDYFAQQITYTTARAVACVDIVLNPVSGPTVNQTSQTGHAFIMAPVPMGVYGGGYGGTGYGGGYGSGVLPAYTIRQYNQFGNSRIQHTTSKTQIGASRVQRTTQTTQTGNSRLQAVNSLTAQGNARIQRTGTIVGAGNARIQQTHTLTQTGNAQLSSRS